MPAHQHFLPNARGTTSLVPRLNLSTEPQPCNCCYYEKFACLRTHKTKPTSVDNAALLAQRLSDALTGERIVPRFVDSYVEQHGRYGLQVHAALYRDLTGIVAP